MSKKEYHLITSGARVKMLRPVEGGGRMPVVMYDPYRIPNVYRTKDENGKRVTYRFLVDCDAIELQEQIKLGFLANHKISQRDRDALLFENGILETEAANVQLFFSKIPANKGFTGDRGEYPILFEEYKPEVGRALNLNMGLKQAHARVAIEALSEAEMEIKLLKIYGPHFKFPTSDIEEESRRTKIEVLQNAINEADETGSALDIILTTTDADNTDTLIGKALNSEVLSLTHTPGDVMIKRSGSYISLMKISENYTEDQRYSMLRDRLESSEGKPMITTIKQALEEAGVGYYDQPIKKEEPKKEAPVEVPRDLNDEELKAAYEKRFGKIPVAPDPDGKNAGAGAGNSGKNSQAGSGGKTTP